MPWLPRDAHKFTHKARSDGDREYWSRIANAVLHRSGDDEGRAIRIANSALAKRRAARARKRATK